MAEHRDYNPEFKVWIKAERRRLDYTKAMLARALGIHPTTLSQWEDGIHVPTIERQRRLREIIPRLPQRERP